ncbi:integrase [Aeromonas veronii]|uniref:integrase n=1 Tax=Aeromonas veronii TaxID=654 RepID=UPI002444C5C9|nr:integrase [Aeromonas veronii]
MNTSLQLLPSIGVDADSNLAQLVHFYKKNTPFATLEGWEWDAFSWDAKGICKTQARKSVNNISVNFSRDNNLGKKVKSSRDAMKAFHNLDLSDIAKCHISALQIEKSKDVGTLNFYIVAYRYLDNAMLKRNITASTLTTYDFKVAEAEAHDKLESSTFYRIGQRLESIAKFINQKRLSIQKIGFKKSSKRGDTHTASDTRIDFESTTKRHEKLPTHESLIAVATLSNSNLEGDDALFQAMVEIMFTTGLRFDEVICLDVDCLQVREIEEQNVFTGEMEILSIHEIRYRAKKGAGYQTKPISLSMLPILKKGLTSALEILAPVRDTIKCVANGKYDFFPIITEDCELFVTDIWERLNWSSRPNLTSYLKKRNINLTNKRNPNTGKIAVAFHPSDLKGKAFSLAQESIDQLWKQISELTVADSLDKLIFVTQHQQHHSEKRAEPWEFTMITYTQISDYIAGRPEYGIKNVFERKNLCYQGEQIRLTSHQFRHFLDTMLELSDSVTPIEVARYFGRKYTLDNVAYDHTNPAKRVMDNADILFAASNITPEQAKEASVIFTLVDRDEVLETIEDIGTTLITAIGLCKHDYSDSPCGKYYACVRGCSEYYRIKGNQEEIIHLQKLQAEQETRIQHVKAAVDAEYHGSNNWLRSHEELLNGCRIALAIEQDNSISDGELVQVFPNGNNGCVAI